MYLWFNLEHLRGELKSNRFLDLHELKLISSLGWRANTQPQMHDQRLCAENAVLIRLLILLPCAILFVMNEKK